MGKLYEEITPTLLTWIAQQRLFFVATAPLSRVGHVNTSPKGLDCLRVISPTKVAYLDLTGSGAETIAHIRENGRIVLMFCSFTGPPKIVRLHGEAEVITKSSRDWTKWLGIFPSEAAPRAVIVVRVTRVSDSCGYGVPIMTFVENRDTMARWAATKGAENLPAYRLEKNARSIDSLPALDPDDV